MTPADLLAFFRGQLTVMRDNELRVSSAEDIERLAQHLTSNLAMVMEAEEKV